MRNHAKKLQGNLQKPRLSAFFYLLKKVHMQPLVDAMVAMPKNMVFLTFIRNYLKKVKDSISHYNPKFYKAIAEEIKIKLHLLFKDFLIDNRSCIINTIRKFFKT